MGPDHRAASSSLAWLAPESAHAAADGSHPFAQDINMGNAHSPDGDPELAASSTVTSIDEDAHVWQVRTGRPGRMIWSEVDAELADILETAFENRSAMCGWVWDGWTYTYDMITYMQTSPTGRQRAIRRIPEHQAYPYRLDEIDD